MNSSSSPVTPVKSSPVTPVSEEKSSSVSITPVTSAVKPSPVPVTPETKSDEVIKVEEPSPTPPKAEANKPGSEALKSSSISATLNTEGLQAGDGVKGEKVLVS